MIISNENIFWENEHLNHQRLVHIVLLCNIASYRACRITKLCWGYTVFHGDAQEWRQQVDLALLNFTSPFKWYERSYSWQHSLHYRWSEYSNMTNRQNTFLGGYDCPRDDEEVNQFVLSNPGYSWLKTRALLNLLFR